MISYMLRVWGVRGSNAAWSSTYTDWGHAADQIRYLVADRGLDAVVEMVPCINVLGRPVPITGASGDHWSSSSRAWTRGLLDEDGGVRCEPPVWMEVR